MTPRRLLAVAFAAFASSVQGLPASLENAADAGATLVSAIKPKYPLGTRAGVSGDVLADFFVDPAGAVFFPTAIQSFDADFERPALLAVAGWKFTPAKRSGVSVTSHLQVRFHFKSGDRYATWKAPAILTSLDRPPAPKFEKVPTYPVEFGPTGKIGGSATVDFFVAPDGTVTHPTILSSTDKAFEAPSIAAISLWKFEPAIKDGHPVIAHLRVPFGFGLPIKSLDPYPVVGPPDHYPVVERQVAPVYPYALRYSGNEGKVLLKFTVNEEGGVSNVSVVESSHPDFEAPAIEALLQWRFKPGTRNGHPVETILEVPIIFSLNPPGVGETWTIDRKPLSGVPPEFQYDQPPVPFLTAAPVYPFDLLMAKVTGSAKVSFAIDPSGIPHVLKIDDYGHPEFGASARAMIAGWRFEPAVKKGKSCWALINMEQNFNRSDRDSPVNDSALRLVRELNKDPKAILDNSSRLDRPLTGRFQPGPVIPEAIYGKQGAAAVIEFIVDHAGHSQLPRIVSSSNTDFGWAAATAVSRWQYVPPTRGGKPVDVLVRVPIEYKPEPRAVAPSPPKN